MKLRVLWVGKTQEEWLKRGIEEYAGRIRRYLPFAVAEAREEKGAAAEAGRAAEGTRLAALVPKNARLVLLDELGEEMDSRQFAAFIARERDSGCSELLFAVGGAYGFSEEFRRRAHRTVALSRMTFTHQMVRLFLLEQLYRGLTIMNGEKYHH